MSDGNVLICVGKLVRRATTLLLTSFPDSDYNTMQNEERATSQDLPDGTTIHAGRQNSAGSCFRRREHAGRPGIHTGQHGGVGRLGDQVFDRILLSFLPFFD